MSNGPTFKVKKTMCASCIHRPDSALDITVLEDAVRDPNMEGYFKGHRECHTPKRKSGHCCRGFWDRHKDSFTLGQLAQRLNFVEYV